MGVYLWNNTWLPWENTILYFPLKSDVKDYSGNNRNPSTTTGTVSFPDNEYASFTDYYCNMSSGYSDWTTNNSFTISYWVKDLTGTARPFVMGQDVWTWTSNSHRWLQAIISNNQVTAYCITNWSQQNSSAYSITSWNRHHIAVTITPWSQMKLYIDWSLKESVSVSSGMRIGVYSGIWLHRTYDISTSPKLNGKVSEIINEKTARTADEISNYYNSTKSYYWIS